ncbi:MAG: mercuric reductase [Lautropia sp.]
MALQHFDVVIIGAGQAASPLATALARQGRTVALVEATHLGGSCVNFGCTPTKAVIASARVAHMARRAGDYGIDVSGVKPDFAKVIARARAIVAHSRTALEEHLADEDNPRLIRGWCRFEGRDDTRFRLCAGDARFSADTVVLDTGTRTRVPRLDGLEDVPALCAENWLAHDELPEHLAIVGAGYIGLEMAQFYRRMGSEVTVIGSGQQVARHEDPEVAQAVQAALEAEGVRFVLGAHAKGVSSSADGLQLRIGTEAGDRTLDASHLFIATGRQPNTDDLGLDRIGLATGSKGVVDVDERLAASVPGIWAAGDVRGGPMFTHTAWDDHRILLSQLLGDGSRTLQRVVPYALFTDPELGRVGMTEGEARRDGRKIRVMRFDLKHNGRAREAGETEGFVKVVVDDATRQILGAAILGHEGAELVHVFIALMNAQAPYSVLEQAIQIHPTYAEALQSAVSG